ncbi:MAG TPA: DUF423 domain-containing protein [Rhizomicrobium sp.]
MNGWLLVAAINGFLAVAAGAFGAHGLQGRLDVHAQSLFETAARYHMYHAFAIGLTALASPNRSSAGSKAASIFFLVGIILFSGSLYALALTGLRGLAIVTPFGGISLLIGWAALAWAACRKVA